MHKQAEALLDIIHAFRKAPKPPALTTDAQQWIEDVWAFNDRTGTPRSPRHTLERAWMSLDDKARAFETNLMKNMRKTA